MYADTATVMRAAALIADRNSELMERLAQAPTDEEREALELLIAKLREAKYPEGLDAWLTGDVAHAILAAGFRRPAQGEPTDALDFLDEMNEQGRIEYGDYRNLHDLISVSVEPPTELFPGTLDALDSLMSVRKKGE